ncbi:S-layer homology domain-containing protein [Cohnella herbarum]|uniref:SLH domain-containing protein n=1 Tax=Cohnella herbarum TaxID=2728023 RepID=A0A7Z2VQT4_9BACL|nr:S-layer homology domain-containing protein [Cohnella herbarum]QJD87768.1 hypothetical protein HH215_34300 [Cohnella herbarum]
MLLKRSATLSLSLLLIITIVLSSATAFGAASSDIGGHWAERQLSEWKAKGYLKGYPDGTMKPNEEVTRAEFVTLVNRSFGLTEATPLTYKDVTSFGWLSAEIGKAVKAGYIGGYSDNSFRPHNKLNRQEAAKAISSLLKLDTSTVSLSKLDDFKDKKSIASTSKAAVAAVVAKGLMKGFVDGTFRPEGNITRAEAVVLLNRALSVHGTSNTTSVYDKAGIYGPDKGNSTINGDVVIVTSGVILRNTTITGNLIFAEGIGDGEATLDGVTVQGTTTVKGGGENSIHFKDSVLLTIVVDKKDGKVRIVVEGSTTVTKVIVYTSVTLDQTAATDGGILNVEMTKELQAKSKVTLIGHFASVEVYAKSIEVDLLKGLIDQLNVHKDSGDITFNLAQNTEIARLVLDAVVKVIGLGTIVSAEVNNEAKGTTFETPPKSIKTPSSASSGSTSPSVTPPTTPPVKPEVPVNVAFGKALTSNATLMDEAFATDGKIDNTDLLTEAESGLKYIQIDFGGSHTIKSVYLWHYFGDGRTYHDVIVQLSNDQNFAEYTTVFNNDSDNTAGLGAGTDEEYAESDEGKAIAVSAVKAKYMRIYSNGSTKRNGADSPYNHYVEVEAWTTAARPTSPPAPIPSPIVPNNVAAGKSISSNISVTDAVYATDGTSNDTDLLADVGAGLNYIQIDFGRSYDINAVNLWHYYGDARTYQDVIVQLSNDPNFAAIETTTVFNNDSDGSAALGVGSDAEYAESSAGKEIKFNAINARYIRMYSNGSTKTNGAVTPYNHYVEVQVFAETPAYRTNNVTFLNPDWVVYPQTDRFIQNTVNKMTSFQIKHQMIDVGFFDRVANTATFEDTIEGGAIDGTLDPNAYKELRHWITVSRATNPYINLIGAISGNSFMHVQNLPYTDRKGIVHTPTIDKATMHDRIAAKAKYLVETFELDGINIDFEPLRSGASANDYLALIKKVRAAIGPDKHLSICGNPFPKYMPDEELTRYGEVLDMIIMMDYDTGADPSDDLTAPWPANPYTVDEASFLSAIKDNTIRISEALSGTDCVFIPLGPGRYGLNDYHRDYENARNHSIAVNEAIAEGAVVGGSGVWWWEQTKDDEEEKQQFIDYWINGN